MINFMHKLSESMKYYEEFQEYESAFEKWIRYFKYFICGGLIIVILLTEGEPKCKVKEDKK